MKDDLLVVAHLLALFARERRARWTPAAVHGVALPIAVVYLGTRVAAGDPGLLASWTAAALAVGVGMSSAWLAGVPLLEDRFAGRRALLRGFAVSARSYHGAHLVAAATVGAVVGGVGVVAAGAAELAVVTLAGGVGAAVGGAFAGTALGGLAAVVATRSATLDDGLNQLVLGTMALVAASPVFYPAGLLPLPLRALATLSPFTHLATVLRAAVDGARPPVGSLVALGALALFAHAASHRRLR